MISNKNDSFILAACLLCLVNAENLNDTTPSPTSANGDPYYKDYAKVARYLVHKSGKF